MKNLQYPHWCGRRDKRGFPIFVLDVSYLDHATVTEYENTRGTNSSVYKPSDEPVLCPNAMQLACVVHDSLTRFVLPLCSAMLDRPNPATLITGGVYLIDITEFGLKQAWDLKSYTQDISKLLALGYPEIIDRVYVGLPSPDLVDLTY